jgi:hypothetical protein
MPFADRFKKYNVIGRLHGPRRLLAAKTSGDHLEVLDRETRMLVA